MRVRPSFRDLRFGLLVAGEAVNAIGGWASAIALWGFAAYRFDAGPVTVVCWAAPPAVLNPLLGAAGSAGQVAGPLAASAAIALSGFPAAFILDAATYLIGAAVVVPLPLRPVPAGERPGWLRELSEGIRLVARRREPGRS